MGGYERYGRAGRPSDAAASRLGLAGPRSRIRVAFVAVTLALAVAGPTALAQSTSTAPDASSWTRISLPEGLVGLELHDVVAGGPGFIAVGGGFGEGSTDPEALILTSADGTAWQRVGLQAEAATGQMRAVISVGGAWYMAVGGQCCPDVAAVWISADGVSWQRLPDSPQFFSGLMTDVTVTSAGFLAVGCRANLECVGGAVWQSADGATWRGSNPFLWIPNAVVAMPSGFVAVGQTDPYGGRPVAASSADGSDWQPAALPEVVGGLSGVVVVEDGLIAVGETRDPDTMQPTGLAFSSGDGVEWTAIDALAIPTASFDDLLVAGDAKLLVGFRQRQDGRTAPSAWWITAETGAVLATLSPEGDDGLVRSVAIGADGRTLVAVGTVYGGTGSDPAIWVSVRST